MDMVTAIGHEHGPSHRPGCHETALCSLLQSYFLAKIACRTLESSNFSKDFSNKVSETLFVNFNSDLFNSGSLRSFLIYFLRSQSRMSGKFLTIVI